MTDLNGVTVTFFNGFDSFGNQVDLPKACVYYKDDLVARIYEDLSKDICRGIYQAYFEDYVQPFVRETFEFLKSSEKYRKLKYEWIVRDFMLNLTDSEIA